MKLKIDPESGTPLYAQIMAQVEFLVASGRLKPGDAMPPIRALAEQLLINPNTVARAYRELETAGVIHSRVGSGTVVAEGVSPLARRERLRLLTEQVDTLLAKAAQLNFSVDEVQELMGKRAQELRRPGKEKDA
jgi:GntR family transcriptional regulator